MNLEAIIEKLETDIGECFFKTHPISEVASALMAGKEVWYIDSGTDGNDDVIVCREGKLLRIITENSGGESVPDYSYSQVTIESNSVVVGSSHNLGS